ncbi:MAG: deoxyribodipyrimidine photolyase [Acidimicrobiia bacterium]|nr:deoxyribodipyrimidine photolyase [Acidimicrobiia bacterium]
MTRLHTSPYDRVRVVHDRPPTTTGQYVLYWMIGARRPSWNFALDRAVEWARELGKPVLVLEALRSDYRWASDRLHRFVLDGMLDNEQAFAALGVGYYGYVERTHREGRGLLRALANNATVVVTDRTPIFDLPAISRAGARDLDVRFEEVDGNGILPLDTPPSHAVYPTAYAFRRHLQRVLPNHLDEQPRSAALRLGDLPAPPAVPGRVRRRWPPADRRWLEAQTSLAGLPIDHAVAPAPFRGGFKAGRRRLAEFLASQIDEYGDKRNHPDDDVSSGLSPYLHFGHLSAHEVVAHVLRHERWSSSRLARTVTGAKEGWWGVSGSAEAFLDQVVTWRELGFNMAARRIDSEQFESLPRWAITTLEAHVRDVRPHTYTLDQFREASTHDPLWNAAQRQLLREGRLHNYLRMLWGKKILEWTASPREALDVMVELNNRFALDGRDPNSYSGIFWVLGRYDRPWPERPIFGTVRYMTSQSTARKLRVKQYLRRYGTSLL